MACHMPLIQKLNVIGLLFFIFSSCDARVIKLKILSLSNTWNKFQSTINILVVIQDINSQYHAVVSQKVRINPYKTYMYIYTSLRKAKNAPVEICQVLMDHWVKTDFTSNIQKKIKRDWYGSRRGCLT